MLFFGRRTVPVQIGIERVSPLPSRVRNIFRCSGSREVDERGLELCERVVRSRRMPCPCDRLDMTRRHRTFGPRSCGVGELGGLARDSHSVMRFAARAPRLRHEERCRRPRTFGRPLERRIERPQASSHFGVEAGARRVQREELVTHGATAHVVGRQLIERNNQQLEPATHTLILPNICSG